MHEAEFGALFARFPQPGLLTAAIPKALDARARIPKSASALAEISAIYQLATRREWRTRLCMFKAKFINPENFDFRFQGLARQPKFPSSTFRATDSAGGLR